MANAVAATTTGTNASGKKVCHILYISRVLKQPILKILLFIPYVNLSSCDIFFFIIFSDIYLFDVWVFHHPQGWLVSAL